MTKRIGSLALHEISQGKWAVLSSAGVEFAVITCEEGKATLCLGHKKCWPFYEDKVCKDSLLELADALMYVERTVALDDLMARDQEMGFYD